MKKILLLSFCFLALFSCSNNDDEIVDDPILGTWLLFSSGGIEVSECEKMTSVEFKSDKTTFTEIYQEINDECVNSFDTNDTWENSDGVYSFNNIESQIDFTSDGSSFRISSGNIVYVKQE